MRTPPLPPQPPLQQHVEGILKEPINERAIGGQVVRHHSVALAAAMSEAVNKPTSQKFTSRIVPLLERQAAASIETALHPEMPVLRHKSVLVMLA